MTHTVYNISNIKCYSREENLFKQSIVADLHDPASDSNTTEQPFVLRYLSFSCILNQNEYNLVTLASLHYHCKHASPSCQRLR